jgi:hypothetical protein
MPASFFTFVLFPGAALLGGGVALVHLATGHGVIVHTLLLAASGVGFLVLGVLVVAYVATAVRLLKLEVDDRIRANNGSDASRLEGGDEPIARHRA